MFRKKKDTAQAPEAMDEALFEALKKQKKRKIRKRIRIILLVLILLGAGGFGITLFLQRQVRTQFAGNTETILTAKAERGTISTVVSGSGMLANVDTQVVSLPAGVEVTSVPVKYGDTVAVGDILATVDMASVRTTISSVQSEIESLDSEIASAKSETVSSTISAKVGGRVKAVYAAKGDQVEDVMVDHGCLALLSMDGYMAAQLTTRSLTSGETIRAVRTDGTELSATVESVIGDQAVVLVSDNGPMLDEEVTFYSAAGISLGSAKLYIHSSLAVTGYAGTVSYVSITENQQVYAYSTLFSLTDTSTTVNYDALLRTRDGYRDTLVELLQLQRNGALLSPIAGSVYSAIDPDDVDSSTATDVVTLSPDKQMQVSITIDEADILSLEAGQQANLSVRSIGDQTLVGTVSEIDKTYSSGSYTALITVDKVSGMIPGMTASVDVRIEGVDDAILIPADALHQTSSGYYVYTGYDTETQQYTGRVDVIPGLSNSSYVEIKSGLQEGDTVYYTEAQNTGFSFGGFGGGNSGNSGFSGFGGGTPGGSSNSGSQRPSGSSNSGSQRPSSSGSGDFGGSSGGRSGG